MDQRAWEARLGRGLSSVSFSLISTPRRSSHARRGTPGCGAGVGVGDGRAISDDGQMDRLFGRGLPPILGPDSMLGTQIPLRCRIPTRPGSCDLRSKNPKNIQRDLTLTLTLTLEGKPKKHPARRVATLFGLHHSSQARLQQLRRLRGRRGMAMPHRRLRRLAQGEKARLTARTAAGAQLRFARARSRRPPCPAAHGAHLRSRYSYS